MKQALTIGLLVFSNLFMTIAWYGHLKFSEWKWFSKLGLVSIILISWGIALFEYFFQVPANKIGFKGSLVFNINKPHGTLRKLTNVSKLNALGWKHHIQLEEGIEKAYNWYVNFKSC